MGIEEPDAEERASAMSALQGLLLPERYRLVRRIADGGMGTVWCARDLTLDRDVAIKLLAQRFLHDEMSVRRFKREARAAARLSSHPNVVTIFDVGQGEPGEDEAGQPFIVMEYLGGGTVADALRLGELSRADALGWLAQAAGALDFAHRCGVIHRDIKLSNFLLDRDRVLHVGDFGIARLGTDDTLTTAGQLIGTAAYLAPERVLGQPATEASDHYSLAVAAFELLVGQRPFTEAHYAAQSRQHLEEPPPAASDLNRDLPRRLDPVLARGMAKRPEDRWPTAKAFVEAVRRAVGEPESAWPAAGTASTRRLRREPPPTPRRIGGVVQPVGANRARIVAICALAVALLGLALALTAGSGSHAKTANQTSARATHRATTHHRAVKSTHPRTTPQTITTASTSATETPAALETRGHELMMAGDYQSAIPVLRQALAQASPGSLIYAYALYDLGRSLLESGNPQAAIPILRQRLAIPNQTPIVAATLQAALRAAGKGPKHGHGGGGGD